MDALPERAPPQVEQRVAVHALLPSSSVSNKRVAMADRLLTLEGTEAEALSAPVKSAVLRTALVGVAESIVLHTAHASSRRIKLRRHALWLVHVLSVCVYLSYHTTHTTTAGSRPCSGRRSWAWLRPLRCTRRTHRRDESSCAGAPRSLACLYTIKQKAYAQVCLTKLKKVGRADKKTQLLDSRSVSGARLRPLIDQAHA